MRDSVRWLVSLGVVALASGCGGSDPAGNAGSGGASGGLGASGSSGAGGVASSAGGAGSGGVATSGGSPATGGSAAGGSAGATGGNAGNGGGPAHVVGACDGLGAVDEFEDITPPDADLSGNGITNLLPDPVHAGTLFVGTDKKGLFKSTNCGADWTKVNTGRNGTKLDSGTLWSMSLDFENPDVIYLGSLYGEDNSLFKSTNGGVDWDSLWPMGSLVESSVDYNFLQDLSMDPTDHEHLVVSFHADCKGDYSGGCMGETTDGGASWRLFDGPTSGWSEGAGPLVLGATTWLLGTTQNGLYYTSDSGGNWEKVAAGADHQLYHAADGSYYTGSDYGINHSADGHSWMKIDGSPNGYGIIGDGTRLFNSLRNAGNNQPYFTSPESDGMTWTPLASPDMAHGAVYFGYDPDHHVLYSANTSSGLWRMVTH